MALFPVIYKLNAHLFESTIILIDIDSITYLSLVLIGIEEKHANDEAIIPV